MKKRHYLKTLQRHFSDVQRFRKKAEIRFDDRGYEVGDVIVLEEFDGEQYTGVSMNMIVSHVFRGGQFGLAEGFVMLSLWGPQDFPSYEDFIEQTETAKDWFIIPKIEAGSHVVIEGKP